jgi:dihydrofolate reductase
MPEKPMRKIIVYIATSADGYIARPDGNVDWLNRPRPAGNYGMGARSRKGSGRHAGTDKATQPPVKRKRRG